jgi:hypothetical protein
LLPSTSARQRGNLLAFSSEVGEAVAMLAQIGDYFSKQYDVKG